MRTFPSIRIEGSLLGPDVLDQLLASQLAGQRPADFGVDAKRKLTDEIASAFADARALWEIFQHRLDKLSESDIATTVTRDAWMIPFLGLLGYEPHYNQRAYTVDGLNFPVSHRANEAEDSPPIHIVGARQELGRIAASGRPRLAPHSLLQEYLNRTEALWGVVTNGLILRVLRDSTFVRRQAYVEFDIQAIIEEKRFEDFSVLYRLIHRTRLPLRDADARNCLLESYYAYSEEQGGRVRDHLRDGVEQCITLLGNAFLSNPANAQLQRRVSQNCAPTEQIKPEEFYKQLLRIVYRFLFLLVSEDRGLLGAEPLYRDHYGVGRLRRLVDMPAAYTHHDDIWRSLRLLWKVLTDDTPQPLFGGKVLGWVLGLPVLNGELFSDIALDQFTITNRDLLEAFWWLVWYEDRETRSHRRVNYAALDVEELGSVYESLIEFHPTIQTEAVARPIFSLLPGTERKMTGSYYTPPQLVNELIESALVPVLRDRLAANRGNEQQAILSIRVCDPACGSGHFLLAATRRLGKELARVRSGEDEPAPEGVREAIRDVVSHCIYGVDKNPLAVDLCRVALWIESYTEDKPLTFLDHRIRWGDSLVGVFDNSVLHSGIPDKALIACRGDDKLIAREAAKKNRDERLGAQDLFAVRDSHEAEAFTQHSRDVDAIRDDSPELVRRKRDLFEASHRDPTWLSQKQACDLWTAAFFQNLNADTALITTAVLADHLSGRPIDARLHALAARFAEDLNFFHWPLEFPEVLAQEGFDVILSNPPWERIKLQEQEFFAARDPDIAAASNKAARKKLIDTLPRKNPTLHAEFSAAVHAADCLGKFLRQSNRYSLTATGDINTYAVFAEAISLLIAPSGRVGIIIPIGIATDDTTKRFFNHVVERRQLAQLIGFENEELIFPAVHHSNPKFCAFTLTGSQRPTTEPILSFFIRRFEQIRDIRRQFTLTPEDFEILNPNTHTCPTFRTQADSALARKIYQSVPVLIRDSEPDGNNWGIRFMTMFHMSGDSELFLDQETPDRMALVEGKMIWHSDHRFGTYEGATQAQLNLGNLPQTTSDQKADPGFRVVPRYWVKAKEVYLRTALLPKGLLQAIRENNNELIVLGLGHLLFGRWLLTFSEHVSKGLFEAWRSFIDRFQFAQHIPPTSLGLSGNNPPSLSPADSNYLPASSLDQLRSTERETTAWYAVDQKALAEYLNFVQQFPVDVSKLDGNAAQDVMSLVEELLDRTSPRWFLGFRDITSSIAERTAIFSIVPRAGVGNNCPLMLLENNHSASLVCCLLANFNSLVLDYVTRQKIAGTHMNFFFVKQLPVLPPSAYTRRDIDFILPRVLELVYTSYDLKPFAQDCGYEGEPFKWDEDRRALLRAELDGYYANLYGLTRDELRYVLDPKEVYGEDFPSESFRVLKEKELRQFGEFRTQRMVLAAYDELMRATTATQPRRLPTEEFAAIAYPSNDVDRAICAAALTIVDRSASIDSGDHLEALLLATHPQWCKVFIGVNDARALDRVVTANNALSVNAGESIRWKTSRDYLEKRKAITIARNSSAQPITKGVEFAAVTQSLAASTLNIDGLVSFVLKAHQRIKELRQNLTQASADEKQVLRALHADREQELAA